VPDTPPTPGNSPRSSTIGDSWPPPSCPGVAAGGQISGLRDPPAQHSAQDQHGVLPGGYVLQGGDQGQHTTSRPCPDETIRSDVPKDPRRDLCERAMQR
jgi:hypothetical protein